MSASNYWDTHLQACHFGYMQARSSARCSLGAMLVCSDVDDFRKTVASRKTDFALTGCKIHACWNLLYFYTSVFIIGCIRFLYGCACYRRSVITTQYGFWNGTCMSRSQTVGRPNVLLFKQHFVWFSRYLCCFYSPYFLLHVLYLCWLYSWHSRCYACTYWITEHNYCYYYTANSSVFPNI